MILIQFQLPFGRRDISTNYFFFFGRLLAERGVLVQPARSILGPNGLKFEKSTTHFIVRWTRVV